MCDTYPMPRTDILLSQLGESSYMNALDVTKGYWQVPLHHQDTEKMSFVTLKGLFSFTMMPFGLHLAAATIHWLVDTL